jgi:aspartate/methionine/tyrosine aminotransferase
VSAPRPFQLERYFARYEFTTRHLLASSDCEAVSLSELLALADDADRAAWDGLRLGYTESPGLLELRERIAAQYPGLAADDLVTAAPEEALYILGRTLLRPGDRVIVTFPGYQSLYEIAAAAGATVERWTPEESAAGWWFDPGKLETLARGGAKAIVVNFPHNPTGALPTPAEWAAVVKTAESASAILVSDEMYRGLEYEPARRLAPGAVACERGVSVGGLSKAYGLPGLRVGWLATRDRAAREAAQAYKDYTTICSSAPAERLAVVALKNADRPLPSRCGHRLLRAPGRDGRRDAAAEQRLRMGRQPRPLRFWEDDAARSLGCSRTSALGGSGGTKSPQFKKGGSSSVAVLPPSRVSIGE